MVDGPATVLGYGELGTCLVGLLRQHDVPTHVWRRPRAAGTAARAKDAGRHAEAEGARLHEDLAGALATSSLVISCVPGPAALAVARAAAVHLPVGTLFVDAASAAPADKEEAARHVTDAGAAYVDAALVGSVAALGPDVPWLVAGPDAALFEPVATALGLPVTVLSSPVGGAARVKLLRSVYLKGRDALVSEMALAAHAHGLLPEVVASIGGPAEQVDFEALTQRILSSAARHSARRADELEAAAQELRATGVSPLATEGSVRRLRALRTSTSDLLEIAGQLNPAR